MLRNTLNLAIGGVHTAENEPPRFFSLQSISFNYFNPLLTQSVQTHLLAAFVSFFCKLSRFATKGEENYLIPFD